MADHPGSDPVDIRTVSELTGLTVDTLRWYEREGLLPLVWRDAAGRRRYPPAAVRFAHLVAALRRTGMPVQDVREFVRMGTGGAWHDRRAALLAEHADAIEQRIARLHRDLATVREKIAHYRALRVSGLDCEDEIGAPPAASDTPPGAASARDAGSPRNG